MKRKPGFPSSRARATAFVASACMAAACKSGPRSVVAFGDGGTEPEMETAADRATDEPSTNDRTAPGPAVAAPPKDASSEGENALTGTVVGLHYRRPLAGRMVVIEGRVAITDGNGRFQLPDLAPAAYDVIVADPNHARISVYRGLHRRHLVLPHDEGPRFSLPPQSARLGGMVLADAARPLHAGEPALVYLFSAQVVWYWSLNTERTGLDSGPAFGPTELRWSSGDRLSGRLTAVAWLRSADGGVSPAASDRPVTLEKDHIDTVNVPLGPVNHGRLAGRLRSRSGSGEAQTSVWYRHRIPHVDSLEVPAPAWPSAAPSGSFDYDAVDLSTVADLCVRASDGVASSERCGLSLGDTNVEVTLQEAISFSVTDGGTAATTIATKTTRFSWTPVVDAVYLLKLDPQCIALPESSPLKKLQDRVDTMVGRAPCVSGPSIGVFTSEVSTTWPDLSGVGVSFPDHVDYRCEADGLGPFHSMDEAMGPTGIAAPRPKETRTSFSETREVTTLR